MISRARLCRPQVPSVVSELPLILVLCVLAPVRGCFHWLSVQVYNFSFTYWSAKHYTTANVVVVDAFIRISYLRHI